MDSLGMKLGDTRQGGKGSPWRWRVAAPVADSPVIDSRSPGYGNKETTASATQPKSVATF